MFKISYLFRNKLFIFLIFGVFFYPRVLDYTLNTTLIDFRNIIRRLWVVLALIICFIYFLQWCKVRRKKLITPLFWAIIAYRTTYIIADIYNKCFYATITSNAREMLFEIALVLLIELIIQYGGYLNLLKSLYYLFSVLIYVNFIAMILYPNGVATIDMLNNGYVVWSDSVNFWDVDNRLSLLILLTVYVAWLYYKSNLANRKFFIILMITILATSILAWSGTGLVSLGFVGSYFLILRHTKIKHFFDSLKLLSGVYFVIFSFVVVLNSFQVFSVLIINILHKDMGLSNRINIWSMAIDMIKNSILFGYGTEQGGALFTIGYETWYAHNQILDILVQGGVLALLFMGIIIHVINKKNKTYKNLEYRSIFNVILMAYLIMGLAEHFLILYNNCFIVFLVLAYNVNVSESNKLS